MKQRQSIRWWPAAVVLALGLAVQLWLRLAGGRSGQEKFMLGALAGVVTLLLLVLWLLFLSRLRWRVRLLAFGGLVVLGALLAASLEIRGVSGDLVPIFAWKWSRAEVAAAESGAPVALGARVLSSPHDYPGFLGGARDATVAGVRLARDWESRPPRELWRRPVGAGWSAFAIAGELAVTQEQHGREERVVAYDLDTGEPVWSHADAGRYETTIAGPGPRATPTIRDGVVYTMGALGRLNALELATGRLLWSRQVLAEHDTEHPEWGKSSSPLVLDELVVVSVGERQGPSLVAYDRATGEARWAAGGDRASYSSPLVAELDGRRQIVIFNRESVSGHDPGSGVELWRYPWSAQQPNVAMPVPIGGDRLLVSSGYGLGSKLLELSAGDDGGMTAELVWESPRLKAKFTNVVVHDGKVYGLDDGVLVCLDPETGERCWKRGRYGHGQMILAGDLLLVLSEKGELVLVEPTPDEHRELASFQVLDGKSWNPPALAGSRLLVRNDSEAAAYELPLAG